MPPTIRSAIQADQQTIRRLIKDAHLNRINLNWPNFVVAEDAGAIVGIGQVKTHGDGSRELASIAVIPARRSQGIGGAIIRSLLAREQSVVHLTCRSRLQGYYERFGFRRLDPSEFPLYFSRMLPIINMVARLFGLKIVVMRLDPAPSRVTTAD